MKQSTPKKIPKKKKKDAAKPAATPQRRITAFDFVFPGSDGNPIPLSVWQGRPLLIVNIASQCGLISQLRELQELWQRYRERGLVVIGVPSNDFRQEPLAQEKIRHFCASRFGVDFPLTGLCHVIGGKRELFYRWAGTWAGFVGTPKWNFHKYLVSPEGLMHDWYFPFTSPLSSGVIDTVEFLLQPVQPMPKHPIGM